MPAIDSLRQNLKTELFPDNDQSHKQGENASLLMARYLSKQESDGDKPARDALFKEMRTALQNVNAGDQLYQKAFEARTDKLKTIAACFKATVIKPDSRLLVGLGAGGVLETGLTLNPLFGTPMIPASTIKGAVAAVYRDTYGKDELYRYLFGDEKPFDDNGNPLEATSGALCFYDAWIVPDSLGSCLTDDIMTPHHSDYYTHAGAKPATDFDDPKPLSFLSVKGKFEFYVSCQCEDSNQVKQWIGFVKALLEEAFTKRGIGSKRSSGYGRLSVERDTTALQNANAPILPTRGQTDVKAKCTEVRQKKNGRYTGTFVLEDYPAAICSKRPVPSEAARGQYFRVTVTSVTGNNCEIGNPEPWTD